VAGKQLSHKAFKCNHGPDCAARLVIRKVHAVSLLVWTGATQLLSQSSTDEQSMSSGGAHRKNLRAVGSNDPTIKVEREDG
jgi:hypothetical protein